MTVTRKFGIALAILVAGAISVVPGAEAAQASHSTAGEKAQAAHAQALVSRVDKRKSVTCNGGRVKVWYRDYDKNRTMLREIYLTDVENYKFMSADVYWRADNGKTTIQKFGLEARSFPTVYDRQTKDVAIAKKRHPYVKIQISSVLTGKCTRYIDLN
ncbi:hypothetical protein [Sphaerisporangium siamense]|uniref:Uncharacterized protein n=1 Tax=Sphaerisporangium siamense TaxID=795645 RepID=A0A7W7D986_9ACTN|nr:hypothetical protein [Sphaerisporangium siamense]MBB4702349.1 hypothetical protein [Sphaerisporangium siamense]